MDPCPSSRPWAAWAVWRPRSPLTPPGRGAGRGTGKRGVHRRVCSWGAVYTHVCVHVYMGTHGCAHSCDVECRNTSIQACALGRKLLWLQSFLKWKHPQRRPLSLPGAFPPRGKFGWASTPWPECPQLSVWLGLRGQEGDSQPGRPPAGREALWGRWCLQWGGALGVLQNPGDPAVGRD